MAAREFEELHDVWERAAQTDPWFAVCSDPSLRGGKWDPDRFFAAGHTEVEVVATYLEQQGLGGRLGGPVLDFGCGLGRLTRAWSRRLGAAVGVDVSESMVQRARELNANESRCSFIINDSTDLSRFGDDHFGLVYSNIVLQHMVPALARGYIREFLRVTHPGGLVVFQLPTEYQESWGARLRRLVRLRTRLRALTGDPSLPAERVEWSMHGVPEAEVRAWVDQSGGRVQLVAWTNATDPDFNGRLRFLGAPPARGWLSRQYVVTPHATSVPPTEP